MLVRSFPIDGRGNVVEFRTVSNVDNANFETISTTKVTYDVLGNITSIKDPSGNSTTIAYDDLVGSSCTPATTKTFAFPTSVVNPASWTNSACYDYSLGRPVFFKDANNITTALSYQSGGCGIRRRTGKGG